MARQYVDYRISGDTGERNDATSIEPITDGNPLNQTTLRRPDENLRSRTDVVREEVERLKFLADANMRWLITEGAADGVAAVDIPLITWDESAGTFEVDTAIVVQPINTPSTDLKETKVYEIDDGSTTPVIELSITSTLFDYERGNNLRIVWDVKAPVDMTSGAGTYAEAFLEGTDEHVLRIEVRNDETTTASHISTALTAVLPAAGFAYTITGNLTSVLTAANIALWDTDVDYTMNGNYERELHRIDFGQINNFFSTNSLSDGDSLAIYYPFLVDPDSPTTQGGRREATPDSGAAPPNTEVLSGQLFITSDEPEKIPLSIPLCKRIGDTLIFVDGTTVTPDAPAIYFGEHSKTIARAADALTTVTDNFIDAYTTSGLSDTEVSVSAGAHQQALEDVMDEVANRGHLNTAEDVTAVWDFQAGLTAAGIVSTEDTAITATGTSFGVAATGAVAVSGSGGTTGVFASGSTYGVDASGGAGVGVRGLATTGDGVSGEATGASGVGGRFNSTLYSAVVIESGNSSYAPLQIADLGAAYPTNNVLGSIWAYGGCLYGNLRQIPSAGGTADHRILTLPRETSMCVNLLTFVNDSLDDMWIPDASDHSCIRTASGKGSTEYASIPLPYLPPGATITEFYVRWSQSTSETGGDCMSVVLESSETGSLPIDQTEVATATYPDTTTGERNTGSNTVAHTYDPSDTTYYFRIRSGNGTGTDYVYSISVYYTL